MQFSFAGRGGFLLAFAPGGSYGVKTRSALPGRSRTGHLPSAASGSGERRTIREDGPYAQELRAPTPSLRGGCHEVTGGVSFDVSVAVPYRLTEGAGDMRSNAHRFSPGNEASPCALPQRKNRSMLPFPLHAAAVYGRRLRVPGLPGDRLAFLFFSVQKYHPRSVCPDRG